MKNRVMEAALEVLKEHQNSIKIVQSGPKDATRLDLYIQGVSSDSEAGQEAIAALKVIGEVALARSGSQLYANFGDEPNQIWSHASGHNKIDLRSEKLTNHPLAKVARLLADSGINFPGSSAYHSKTVA